MNLTTEGSVAIIGNFGREFSFENHQQFRDVLKEAIAKNCKTVSFNFSGLEYLDSSAIGMLNLAYKDTKQQSIKMEITNCSGYVLDVLKMVGFDKLFKIA